MISKLIVCSDLSFQDDAIDEGDDYVNDDDVYLDYYDNDEYLFDVDDECLKLQAQFDNADLPPGVEAHFPGCRILLQIFGGAGTACLPLGIIFAFFFFTMCLANTSFWFIQAETAWDFTVLGYLAKLILGILGNSASENSEGISCGVRRFLGRLTISPEGKLIIDYTGEGPLLVEAEANCSVLELGIAGADPMVLKNLVYDVPCAKNIIETPFFRVEVGVIMLEHVSKEIYST
uniref:Uncharacterized protein n=1 Tax=Chenopodium quinoa TaxID=63459 RepID=A0A803M474_CHEQI